MVVSIYTMTEHNYSTSQPSYYIPVQKHKQNYDVGIFIFED